MKFYTYIRIHIPTSSCSEHLSYRKYETLKNFFDDVCDWNNQQPGVWAYAPLGEKED